MKLGFIGTGEITKAVVIGILRSKLKVKKIYLSERNKKISSFLRKKNKNIQVEKDNQLLIDKSDWVVWAAWADRVTFEEIKKRSGYSESDVIKLMRKKLKPSSFKLWRKRAKNQSIKHRKKFELSRKEIRRKIKKNDYI